MTMNSRLHLVEFTGLAGIRDCLSGWLESAAVSRFRSPFGWLAVALLAGFGAWMLLAGSGSKPRGGEMAPTLAVATEPAPSPTPEFPPRGSPSTPAEVIMPIESEAVDGLRISSQFWRRGGLGSNALVTFTLRNRNHYAVKDVEISCVFSRRDGRHLTDRTRLIHDTVKGKSRKTFARMHIGFVNINADRAKCAPVAATHA